MENGLIPALQANNHTYGQSLATARYAAKLAGLYPIDSLIALKADSIVDVITELYNAGRCCLQNQR
ncbi:hypothetical protein THRCLA_21083 [Thraustotheca clavata]|uniref:GST N-terminal domain-containing protein n=1 Tax=Thraustotheca clavata TaxID=74557 RepID=A0A1W0A0B1_9STRA|nr:hypothetical protein THRCLA_21083 [Thraustotheca clavata]